MHLRDDFAFFNSQLVAGHRRFSVGQSTCCINYPTPCGARFPAATAPENNHPLKPYTVAAHLLHGDGEGQKRRTPLLSEPELKSIQLHFRWKCVQKKRLLQPQEIQLAQNLL
jgi:hypothetical protein